MNVPVTGGLNYAYPASEKISIYGEFGLGVNCAWGTPQIFERSGFEEKTTYNPSFALCYGLEGGILIQNKYTIGLRYNQLGTHQLKYTETTTYQGDKNTEKGKTDKQPVSNITLAFGIRF